MNTEIKFESLNISEETLKAVEDMGFERPSSVQSEVIPVLLEGKDVIAQAQTGTGKTAAFGIPLAELVDPDNRNVQAIILTPTRELAIQIAEEMSKICKYKKAKELPIYGGQSIDRQIRALKSGVQIIIGTPGRVLDHINRKTLKLGQVKMVVLDEADEMLNMGFLDDIESILSNTSQDRQTMLFSATMPDRIRNLSKRYMHNPTSISITPQQVTVDLIEQYYYEVKEKFRFDSLCRILETEDAGPTILFCRTKRNVDELVEGMQTMGYSVEGLHGDINQTQRLNAVQKLKSGVVDFLVATDVAARGLDIENITHVINYNIPEDPESYVHRIGRTGRAGREGTALTLVTAREFRNLKLIEQYTRSRMKRKDIPTIEDVIEQKMGKLKDSIVSIIEEGKFAQLKSVVLELSEEYDLVDVSAAALKCILDTQQGNSTDSGNDLNVSEQKPNYDGNNGDMVRCFINIGRKDKVAPGDIVRAIAEACHLPGNIVGRIDIYNEYSFVDIGKQHADRVLDVMDKNTIKGKRVNIERAKAKRK